MSKRVFAMLDELFWVIAANRIFQTIKHTIRATINPWRRDAYKVHIPTAVEKDHEFNASLLLQTRAENAGDKVYKIAVRRYDDFYANRDNYRYAVECTCGHVEKFNFNGYQENNYELSRDEARRAAKAALNVHRTHHRFVEIGNVPL